MMDLGARRWIRFHCHICAVRIVHESMSDLILETNVRVDNKTVCMYALHVYGKSTTKLRTAKQATIRFIYF